MLPHNCTEDGRQIDPPASSYAIMQRASPYCGENPGPGKDVRGELEPRPGIREQPGSLAPDERSQQLRRMSASPPIAPLMCRLLPSGRKADMGGAQRKFLARGDGNLWFAGKYDVVAIAEHKNLRCAPNDALQVYHGPHAQPKLPE